MHEYLTNDHGSIFRIGPGQTIWRYDTEQQVWRELIPIFSFDDTKSYFDKRIWDHDMWALSWSEVAKLSTEEGEPWP